MASARKQVEPEDKAARTAAIAEKLPLIPSPGRSRIVREGRLPVSEFALDRVGAGSPFGDDLSFPLPAERLTYTHPSEDAHPQHH